MNNNKTVVYFGPQGSNTEMAMWKIAKEIHLAEFDIKAMPSIIRVIQYLSENDNAMGVVPIENSIEGIVRETVDNLLKSDMLISAEVILPISHCLISKSGDIYTVTKILSYPQALAQCNGYISEKFDSIEIIPTSTSTSEAVKQLNNLPENYAAIGSERAAEVYGLNIIDNAINDEKNNMTRFICLDKLIPEPTGRDKSSIVFTTWNRPGDLVKVLSIFDEYGLNLSYIESRPSRKVFGEYNFFVDLDGHINDECVKAAIDKIKPITSFYKFLGSYPKASFV